MTGSAWATLLQIVERAWPLIAPPSGRGARRTIAMLSIGQGVARILMTSVAVSILDARTYGVFQIVLGLALMLTATNSRRCSWYGRMIAVLLAVVSATLAADFWTISWVGVFTLTTITYGLIGEAGTRGDC